VTKKNVVFPNHFISMTTSEALGPFISDDSVNSYLGMSDVGSSAGIGFFPGVCEPRCQCYQPFLRRKSRKSRFLSHL